MPTLGVLLPASKAAIMPTVAGGALLPQLVVDFFCKTRSSVDAVREEDVGDTCKRRSPPLKSGGPPGPTTPAPGGGTAEGEPESRYHPRWRGQ